MSCVKQNELNLKQTITIMQDQLRHNLIFIKVLNDVSSFRSYWCALPYKGMATTGNENDNDHPRPDAVHT